MIKNIFFFIFLVFVFAVLDLESKHYFAERLASQSFDFGLFKLVLAYNTGIAFSLPLTGILQHVSSFAVLLGFLYYIHVHWNWQPKLFLFASAAVVGGALGNIYERVLFGKVTDFIQVFPWFPIFNFADACVSVGVATIFVLEWIKSKQHGTSK